MLLVTKYFLIIAHAFLKLFNVSQIDKQIDKKIFDLLL